MRILTLILGNIMNLCYAACKNYGIAIILFTLISKIVLLPISVWLQYNSIKMVKIQPEINYLKAKYYGDRERIDEEQAAIFKKEKYNPFASVIPVIVQLILLMGLIAVIRNGMEDTSISMDFFGINLAAVPSEVGGFFILSPVLAGLSAWLMCIAQNVSNVLQSEQSGYNKHGMTIFSVALSLYLGWFVPVGVALYWIASNLLAIAQLYLLNIEIPPKKYVDYERLEDSKKTLKAMEDAGKNKGKLSAEEKRREKEDFKRFFSVLNKHLVFYSEGSGFYKYYKGIIAWLLANSNLVINYITSDPNDQIFEISKTESRIKPYFISEKRLITLMMRLEADIVVMTMPDLENYHIKRSYLKKDIEYIYIPHGMDSLNLTMRTGSIDHYDTVFCTGLNLKEEIEATETAYGLPKKRLVECGYTLLDDMLANYEKSKSVTHPQTQVVIAPSWQDGNIVDSCLETILNGLKDTEYKITVRPHPQHVRHQGAYMEALKKQYESDKNIEIQTDFSSNSTIFDADILITDWSGIAFEYAYTTLKPVLFVNTPMKIMNPEYQKINVIPINIWARDSIGKSYDVDKLDNIAEYIGDLMNHKLDYREAIVSIRDKYIYNLGNSDKVGGEYIITQIRNKIAERKR